MSWARMKNMGRIRVEDVPVLAVEDLNRAMREAWDDGCRAVSHFGLREGGGLRVVSVWADDRESSLLVSSSLLPSRDARFPSATPDIPPLHLFEREIHESFGATPEGHPWLKPVRFPWDGPAGASVHGGYPFFALEGEGVHEVAVGPVHAGVIEPGHFRFQCTGETVHHLEIQLGYQHRGVERMLEDSFPFPGRHRASIAESIAGDSAVSHAWAYAGVMEALCGAEPGPRAGALRAVALELERLAAHLGDLGALCSDVAYMTGQAVFGALRTRVINASMSVCGSRFGRGWVRPGGVAWDIGPALAASIAHTVGEVRRDAAGMAEIVFSSSGVLSRMERTGAVGSQTARDLGLVGPGGRASGLCVDVRSTHPAGVYRETETAPAVLHSGDVLARALVRVGELGQSADLIAMWLGALPEGGAFRAPPARPAGAFLAVALVEGWRGETAHAVVTDSLGSVVRYKVKDPSFNNWYGLAMAVRGGGVSDFPLCNKSFNLSYCGFDL